MKEKDSDDMLKSMIEKIKTESIVYDDFLGRDLCLIVETHEELINSLKGCYFNMVWILQNNGKEGTSKYNEYDNKLQCMHDLKFELAIRNNDIEFKKQAIEYLSRESKIAQKERKAIEATYNT